METNIETLKNVMKKGMIDNFTNDGTLIPVFFWLENNQPIITQIPNKYLQDNEGKSILGGVIRKKCADENVTAAGIVFEANGVKMNPDKDSETVQKLMKGEMKVSDMDNREDIIVLVFSTPDKHEIITYNVDCKNKKVIDEHVSDGENSGAGIFNSFFKWEKDKK